MSPRVTALLFVIALALGAFVFLYELDGDRDPGVSDLEAPRVFAGLPSDPDLVESVSFTTEEGTPVRVERREGRWRVVVPVDAPADQLEIEGMVSTLVNLAGEGVIEQPQAASVYGLDDTSRSLSFRVAGSEHQLQLGGKTPVGPNSYVSASSSDRVFIVPTWKLNSLSHSLVELRDRRILPFDPNRVERLTVSWPGGGVTVVRNASNDAPEDGDTEVLGEWKLVAPADWRADDSTIERLLSDLSFLRAESFIDEEQDDADAGLSEPAFAVSLVLARAENQSGDESAPEPETLHLRLGTIIDGSQRVARGRSGSLFRLPEESLADLPHRVVRYRYRVLSNFDESQAQALELIFHPVVQDGQESGAEAVRVAMAKTPAGWTEVSNEALAAGVSERLVAELAKLTAVGIVAESMGEAELAALGLHPAHATFRVLAAPDAAGEAKLLCEIGFGNTDPSRGILAKAAGNDVVYRLDYALTHELPLSYDAFVDTFALKESGQGGDALEAESAAPLLSPETD